MGGLGNPRGLDAAGCVPVGAEGGGEGEVMRLTKLAEKIRWQHLTMRLGFKNLWRFRSAVWHFDTCDWAPMMRLMHVGFREMAIHHRDHSHTMGGPKRARQLMIVSELCRRLDDDEYSFSAWRVNDWDGVLKSQRAANDRQWKHVHAHEEYLVNQDITYLGKMLRHLRMWWD